MLIFPYKGGIKLNKNKLNMIIAIIASVAIITIGDIMFYQMTNNHQANQLTIEKCFDNFDQEKTVVIKKDGFWSLVTCENK